MILRKIEKSLKYRSCEIPRVGTQKHRQNIKQQHETFFWGGSGAIPQILPTLEEERRTHLTLNRYVPTPATAHALLAEHVAPAIGFRSRGYSCWYRGSRDSSGTTRATRDRTTAVVSTLS